MTSSPLSDPARIRSEVRTALEEILAARRAELAQISAPSAALADRIAEFCEGGKMLRPRFAVLGALAIGEPTPELVHRLVQVGAGIELVQAAALLHDDVIDHSDVRRGRPAAHVAAARQHRSLGLAGDSAEHGIAVAIILGDLALTWARGTADQALESTEHRAAATREFDALCTEVMAGQHLDILNQAGGYEPGSPVDAALDVIRWKTVPYTVLRPVRLGARLMGASDMVLEGLTRWSVDIGTAFQLRDDLLGAIGASAATGKPEAGDILEGKRTVLLAEALSRASADDREVLAPVLTASIAGEDQARLIAETMRRTGAVEATAQRIRGLEADASQVLESLELHEEGRSALASLGREACDLSALPLG